MFRLLACAGLLTGMFAHCSVPATGRDDKDKVPKVEIAKRGKAATAFVEISPKGGAGTAFCVHPSGLFVTNEHVVRLAGDDFVTLVLNPSLDAQKILKAKVIRIDKAADLALLRAAVAADLPSLRLGAVERRGRAGRRGGVRVPPRRGARDREEGVPRRQREGAGSVTSLRLKGGQLQSIQIDVALTFGNSGGPVLDDTGRVIGVVVSGRPGTGINQAIPVNILERFLKAPDLAFTPPELTRANLDKPLEFKANVVSFTPKAPESTLKLILQAGDQEPREFPMKKQGGLWVTTAAAAATATARVELSARFGAANITGTTDDVVFKVANKPMRLSGVRRIDFKSKASVLLADGRTTVEGEITGLRPVEMDLAGQKVKIDLAKATQLILQPAPEIVSVIATVVASVEGKEVARTETRMPVREATRLASADASSVVITPPALPDDKVVKKLPDIFTDVVVGGGGRYLIFHLAKLKKLAVFDVNEARVTKYIPLAEDDVAFTAGLDCIVIGLKDANRLEQLET